MCDKQKRLWDEQKNAVWEAEEVVRQAEKTCETSVSSPRNKGGGYTLAGRRGDGGVNILEDERNRIALLQ